MLAAMVMNPVILAAMYAILLALSWLMHYLSAVPWQQALGNARTPGLLYVPFLFLLQGTSLVSFRCAFYPGNDPAFMTFIAWVCTAACCAMPGVIYYYVLRRIEKDARHMKDPKIYDDPALGTTYGAGTLKAKFYCFMFGDHVWASTSDSSRFVEQYGVIFEPVRDGCTWFILVEVSSMLALSLLSSWHPGGNHVQCGLRNMLVCLVLFVFFLMMLVIRPYASTFDTFLSLGINGLLFSAVLFMTIGLWQNASSSHWCFTAAGIMLLLSTCLVILKAVWDLGSSMVDIWVGRKSGARKAYSLGATFTSRQSDAGSLELSRVSPTMQYNYPYSVPFISELSCARSDSSTDYNPVLDVQESRSSPRSSSRPDTVIITCQNY
ncbi:hypothetical protein DIPPA_33184 [Diplonema papillatum]|nr:hypothetical protein DIPPA_33184 [Diplonema papillatum]